MAANRTFEWAQCILLYTVGNRRDQERAVNLLRGIRAIEAAPAVLQLVVASRFQILQFLCEFFGFDLRYHALHSQLLTLRIHTHIARFAAGSQSYGQFPLLLGLVFSAVISPVPFAFQSLRSCRPSIRANSRLLPFRCE